MSKICEQDLQSILEYLPHENKTESSKYLLSRGSFPKESRWAGSLVRIGRRPPKPVVVGSNPTPPA